jgi:hypothetical protein
LDLKFYGDMLGGLYDSPAPPTFNCSSKCQWLGNFTTLGFARSCQNITSATIATKKCVKVADGEETDDDTSESTRNCTMKTPSGLNFLTIMAPSSEYTYLTASPNRTDLTDSGPDPVEFFTFAIYKVDRFVNDKGNNKILSEEVQECGLSVAAYTYSNITAEGNDVQLGTPRVTSEFTVRTGPPGAPTPNQTSIYSAPGLPDLILRREDIRVLKSFFEVQFNLSLELGVRAELLFTPFSSPDVNVSALLQRMVLRMTDHVATGPNTQPIRGDTLESVIFVRANYNWMTLAIAVEAGALVLLVSVMWLSRPSTGVPLWKHSALALLYHYIREPDDPHFKGGYLQSDMTDPDEMEKLAKKTVVQLI